jgi:hypothetical protein
MVETKVVAQYNGMSLGKTTKNLQFWQIFQPVRTQTKFSSIAT